MHVIKPAPRCPPTLSSPGPITVSANPYPEKPKSLAAPRRVSAGSRFNIARCYEKQRPPQNVHQRKHPTRFLYLDRYCWIHAPQMRDLIRGSLFSTTISTVPSTAFGDSLRCYTLNYCWAHTNEYTNLRAIFLSVRNEVKKFCLFIPYSSFITYMYICI